MAKTKEYVSPDGFLKLVVKTDDDGDVSIGFANSSWHTHADILAELSGLPQQEAVEQYVQSVLHGEAVVAILRKAGELEDIYIADDPRDAEKHPMDNESVELRYWNGDKWKGSP